MITAILYSFIVMGIVLTTIYGVIEWNKDPGFDKFKPKHTANLMLNNFLCGWLIVALIRLLWSSGS